ncbi:unnamed protein product [Phaedon cochleariae]|uniref:Uncharacterized protein n=1 Tax=Phaedon cochleariae TaxID=80249 RepID=A0A9N9X3D8_PHACE|nr:unnamed protein product [Phaedon cochleariae]
MGTREILTLQFGHYANFVGTHWWNLQERAFEYSETTLSEINHDVLYREGLTSRSEVTFTPRLLLVDLKGSLKSLPEKGDLYDPLPQPSKVEVEWDESVDIKASTSEQKNEFQTDLEDPEESKRVLSKNYKLEEEVNVWSDFLYAKFHPRTVNVLREYQHCNENTPFDAYPLGVSLWKTQQFEEDFSDKIRNYIEECDHFQGFQILTDCTNAFAGLTSACLEHLRDEYDRKSVLVFPVVPPHFADHDAVSDEEKHQAVTNDSARVVNTALSFNEFASYSSLFVPLGVGSKGWRRSGPKREFAHVEYDPKIPYHSSAILASALETVSMKYRLRSTDFTLSDLGADLSQNGRKAAAASLCLPFPIEGDLLDCLDKWEGPLYRSITPGCDIGTYRMMQHVTLRGIPEDRLKKPETKAGKQRELPAYRCRTIEEMMAMYLSYSTQATASNVTVVHKGLDVRSTFPRVFRGEVGKDGVVSAFPRDEKTDMTDVETRTPQKTPKKRKSVEGKQESPKKPKLENGKTPQKFQTPKQQKNQNKKAQNSVQKSNKKVKQNSESETDQKVKPFPGTAQIQSPKPGKPAKAGKQNSAKKDGERKPSIERKPRRKLMSMIKDKLTSDDTVAKSEVIKNLETKLQAIQSRPNLTKTARRKIKMLRRLKNIAEGKAPDHGTISQKPKSELTESAKRRDRKRRAALKSEGKGGENVAAPIGKKGQQAKGKNAKTTVKQEVKIVKTEEASEEEDSDDEEESASGEEQAVEGEDSGDEEESGEEEEGSGEEEEDSDEEEGSDDDEEASDDDEEETTPQPPVKVSNKKQKGRK